MLIVFLFLFFYLSMGEPDSEALGNKSAIVSLVGLRIVSFMQQQSLQ